MTPSIKRWMVPAACAGLGAALMYFFDPQRGRRRRAVTRDRTAATVRRASDRARKKGRYMEGKAHGLVHEMRGEAPKPSRNDATLKHKIESEVLRNYDGKINVNVDHGVAVLRGELQQPEQITKLEEDVARVPGVKSVENLLHLPNTAGRGKA